MSYKINPVKAAVKAHKNGNCGIHNLNDTCFGVCAAFKGSDNNWSISPDCECQCEALIEDMRKADFGVGWCDHQAPRRPVNWNQAPHFFPEYFNHYKSVPKALNACYARCNGLKNNSEQCAIHCKTDSYAVEGYSSSAGYNDDNNDDDNSPDFSGYEKAHPAPFWIGVSVAIVFFIFFVYILIRFLTK